MFGELRVVPSADLGEIGQPQGQAASFNWKWYYSAPAMLIWLALILALLVPKANHNVHIAWILVPLAVVNLAWLAFKKLTGMPSSFAVQSDTFFQSMAIGIAVLWLIADYLQKLGGFVRFFLSFAVVLIVAGLGTLSYCSGFSTVLLLSSIIFILMVCVLLLATTVSGLLCRRQYKPFRFMLWLGLWVLVASVAAFCVFYTVVILVRAGSSRLNLSQMILGMVMPGVFSAAYLYALNLPFMLLGFAHPFFRERLCACLGLQLVPADVASQTQSEENAPVASVCEEN